MGNEKFKVKRFGYREKCVCFFLLKGSPADATDVPQPWGLLCNTVMKKCFLVFPSNGAPVEWNWQGNTEVLGGKPVPVPLCPPQIPHGLTRYRTRAFAVRGRPLTAWAMTRPRTCVNLSIVRYCFGHRIGVSLTFIAHLPTRFNFKEFYILPTDYICVFCIDSRTNCSYLLACINWTVLTLEAKGVCCPVRS
jgi:hypothetical protein